jgi:sulfatase modifying factor 1
VRWSFLLCALASTGGCNLILGIEDHELAPMGSGGAGEGGAGLGGVGQGGVGQGGVGQGGVGLGGVNEAGAGGNLEEPGGGVAGSAGAAGDTIATGGLSGGGSGGDQGSVIAGSGGMAPVGGAAGCEPGATRCKSDDVQETCDEQGSWGEPKRCAWCVQEACVSVPSCEGLPSNCGPEHDESCCRSPLVEGRPFVLKDQGADEGVQAEVSNFRLDRFEVTVARFQKFRTAWSSGWRPGLRAGKHAFLNDEHGLLDTGSAGGYEKGWNPDWDAKVVDYINNEDVPPDDQVFCETADAGNEPVRCIRWWEAYAFCIWDEGFLPSEAEWYYAASGGVSRLYPWDGSNIDCDHANYSDPDCPSSADEVGARPKGDGRWGQADLSGNVWEWVLDFYHPYKACINCTNGEEGVDEEGVDKGHSLRGGAFETPLVENSERKLEAAHRSYIIYGPENDFPGFGVGMRCARAP